MYEHILFPLSKGITFERQEVYGGNLYCSNYKELETYFVNGDLYSSDMNSENIQNKIFWTPINNWERSMFNDSKNTFIF